MGGNKRKKKKGANNGADNNQQSNGNTLDAKVKEIKLDLEEEKEQNDDTSK